MTRQTIDIGNDIVDLVGRDSVSSVSHLARAVASLRITSEHLEPERVSALLGCEPTISWAKGDTLASFRVARIASFGMWTLKADETVPADLDAQVAAILSRLTNDDSTWAQLRADYEVSLFCGWFMTYDNEGVSITPETMSALGARAIPLEIDLYGGDGNKTPD